jgi:hypothetical protein
MQDLPGGQHGEAPTQAEGMEIVARVLAGDAVASSDFATAYFVPLMHFLRRRHPAEDEGNIVTAAGDSIWAFLTSPEQYNPDRLLIMSYLRMAAERDLSNLRRANLRHWQYQTPWGWEGDTDRPFGPETYSGDEGDDPARIAELNEIVQERHEQLAAKMAMVRDGLKPEEIEAIPLVFDGERRTERFAAILGWQHLDAASQQKLVKQYKDKLQKRLIRSGVGIA